ncbi:hypothetical protein BJX68DRAFT_269318 [Aspergillus pseudodeflectus]|uniref:Uncharacterized protein n=1 Tax=Aspergillus pseudodeflectus TaxID=176178 RepID=A0ABR4JYK3_9EURO
MAYNPRSQREPQPHTQYTYDTHDVYSTSSPGPDSNPGQQQQQQQQQQYSTSRKHSTTTPSPSRNPSHQRRRHSITENHTIQSDPGAMQRYQGTTSRHVSTTMDNGQISQQEVSEKEKSQVQDLEPRESSGLKLRLDVNLDVEVELKAKIRGDLTLALLWVFPSFSYRLFCASGGLVGCGMELEVHWLIGLGREIEIKLGFGYHVSAGEWALRI